MLLPTVADQTADNKILPSSMKARSPGYSGRHERRHLAIAFLVSAAVMALGGVAELLSGVRAEQIPADEA
jgi:hypothetical protein